MTFTRDLICAGLRDRIFPDICGSLRLNTAQKSEKALQNRVLALEIIHIWPSFCAS